MLEIQLILFLKDWGQRLGNVWARRIWGETEEREKKKKTEFAWIGLNFVTTPVYMLLLAKLKQWIGLLRCTCVALLVQDQRSGFNGSLGLNFVTTPVYMLLLAKLPSKWCMEEGPQLAFLCSWYIKSWSCR